MRWCGRASGLARPRANQTTIGVLEHNLLGIPPEPGTAAALVVAFRRAGTCLTHRPLDVTTASDAQRIARCASCGNRMHLGDAGEWVVTAAS
ncbi:hypothetical protein [Streptomyces sp. NPDC047000]|uniref:hypothetical protein n=1 Tax=Streptomyces sp. NPDC047000 TaxID=3155474 RepID=UPI00340B0694